MLKSSRASILALTFALLVAAATAGTANSQTANGKYDTDGDGLIEVTNLEQLDAMRHDLDVDGFPDTDTVTLAYEAAFPVTGAEAVCSNNCTGYELTRSLDFNDADSYASGAVNPDWQPGGDGWMPGRLDVTFDGNGHTVSNLFIDASVGGYVGLFGGSGTTDSVIRSIGLVDMDVTADTSRGYGVGGLVGALEGTISDSYVTGSVTGTGSSYVGGLVAINRGQITDSYAAVSVTGTSRSLTGAVGGLVAVNRGQITDSYATGSVTGTGSSNVGGLVGNNYDTISNSHATGSVTSNSGDKDGVGGLVGSISGGTISASYATGHVEGTEKVGVGGLVGYSGLSGFRITTSYATGSVTGTESSSVGGLVGRLGGSSGRHTLSDSYATGSVTGMGSSYVGGLVGRLGRSSGGYTSDSYATGSVTSIMPDTGYSYVGGLVGRLESGVGASYATGSVTSSVTGTAYSSVGGLVGRLGSGGFVSTSYATGSVTGSVTGTGSSDVGGLAGSAGYGSIGDSFWDTETSGQPTGSGVGSGSSTGLLGRTTAQLQAPTGYTGIYRNWGAVDRWDFGTSSQYPVLKVDFDANGTATWQEFGSQRGDIATLPGAPTGLTATANGQTEINLSWNAPASNGGFPITWYRIEVSANGSTWSALEADTGSTGTSYSHTGLTAGTTRHYRVSAISSAGTGPASNVAIGTTSPAVIPGAPTGLTTAVSDTDPRIDLSWTAPTSTGGAPITGYRIESSTDGNDPWTVVITTTGAGTTYTDDGTDGNGPMFSAGNWPHYRVAAVNRVGTGPFSEPRSAGGDPLIDRYDTNNNGIERGEVIAAIRDYLGGMEGITRADVIRLIRLYLSGG